MTDVFLGLAAGVVKAAVKIWLRDANFASDVGASIVDLVKEKVSGDLDQRRARRFFEDLEVPVARKMSGLLKAEFSRLPENERNAAILAAGDSFDHARLTAQDLFTRDLDPLYLERHILRRKAQDTRDLSTGGEELYDRLVTEGCAYVIDLADQLPHFQAGAFTELLQRSRQILERMDEVLERIPELSGSSKDAQFVTACRRRIATKLDHLQLFGLEFETRAYPLSVAYVSLRINEQVNTGGQAVEEWLATHQRAILVGRAGSGKTTVLQWLAVRACRSDFTGALSKLNEHFPFFIRLRDYVGRTLPQPEEFLATTAPLLIPEAPDNWARRQLNSGRALVLVDGVDEVPVAERPKVTDWLCDLIDRFHKARYVITARPTAVSADWLAEAGLSSSSLEAMPPSLARTFVSNWHEAVRRQLLDNDERAKLDTYEQSMLASITADRYLRDLADTPLLAALLCALNRHMNSNLPRRRCEIYQQTLAMFHYRDQTRGIAPGPASLDLTAQTHLLASLALRMTRHGKSEVSIQEATEEIGRALPVLPGADRQPDAVFRLLLERSGLIREPVPDRVGFVHRTFQEFLAAKAATDSDAIGELIYNADDDQWGEVVTLAAGQANQTQSVRLLQGLLQQGRRGIHRAYISAVACLNEVRTLDAAVRQEVESVIPDLLPPRSMEQAEQLGVIGEPLIPLITRYWSRDLSKAAETVRAASLIGGPLAQELIHHISARTGETHAVMAEVRRAWQYFDAEEFARNVLAPAKYKGFDIEEMKYLQALLLVPSVESLNISALIPEGGIASLDIIQELPQLTRLEITTTIISDGDLTSLVACPKLSDLVIIYGGDGLHPIPLPPSLARLTIARDVRLTRSRGAEQYDVGNVVLDEPVCLADLGQLSHLEEITIEGVRGIDLSELRAKPGLSLKLEGCGVVNVEPLAHTIALTIYCSGNTTLRHGEKLPAETVILRL